MKKLIAAIALVSMVCVAATVRPPATPPPCKWAGQYCGIGLPTSWPKSTNANPLRWGIIVTVQTNYSVTVDQYDFSGYVWQGSIDGVVTTSGTFKITNSSGSIIAGKFGAYGVSAGSYIGSNKERGTFTCYREAVLPK